KLGSVQARAFKIGEIYVDVEEGFELVPGDGQTGYGVLRFAGIGSVTGLVLMPDGRPAIGADVTLRSKFYSAETCNLATGDSHHVRTSESGRFNLIGVNVGPVGVSTTHPFLNTQVGAQ